jgi:hypothetical protein
VSLTKSPILAKILGSLLPEASHGGIIFCPFSFVVGSRSQAEKQKPREVINHGEEVKSNASNSHPPDYPHPHILSNFLGIHRSVAAIRNGSSVALNI